MNKIFIVICALALVHGIQASYDMGEDIHQKYVDRVRNEAAAIQTRMTVWLRLEEYGRMAIVEDEAEDCTSIKFAFRVAQETENAILRAKTRQQQSAQRGRKQPVVVFVGTLRPNFAAGQ